MPFEQARRRASLRCVTYAGRAQLLNRLGDAPRDLFPSSMSFLNAPPVDHTTDLGLSQFQRDLQVRRAHRSIAIACSDGFLFPQQSHFAADLPAMSRLAEKKSQVCIVYACVFVRASG